MNKFKIGDRVVYIGDTRAIGRKGVVTGLLGDAQVNVDWDTGEASYTTPLVHNLRLIRAATVRARVLDEAKRITSTDRNTSYGEPEDNFQRIADYWNVWLQDKLREDVKLGPGDTAALMILVKMAREMNAPNEDNKVDLAGYAACWAEVDPK